MLFPIFVFGFFVGVPIFAILVELFILVLAGYVGLFQISQYTYKYDWININKYICYYALRFESGYINCFVRKRDNDDDDANKYIFQFAETWDQLEKDQTFCDDNIEDYNMHRDENNEGEGEGDEDEDDEGEGDEDEGDENKGDNDDENKSDENEEIIIDDWENW
jgi:hypothetical protein